MATKEPETWKEAVKKCKDTLQWFMSEHERIELMIRLYVFTPRYGGPLMVETPEAALKEAKEQDKLEGMLDNLEKRINLRGDIK